jgi:hypothetical protein
VRHDPASATRVTAWTYNDINNGNSAGPVGNIVRHNIRLNDARKLAFVGIMIAGSGVSGIDVYNNTVHLGKAGGNASARQLTS